MNTPTGSPSAEDRWMLALARQGLSSLQAEIRSLQEALERDPMGSFPFGIEKLHRQPNEVLNKESHQIIGAIALIQRIIEALELQHAIHIQTAELQKTMHNLTESQLSQELAKINLKHEADVTPYHVWKELLEQKLAKIASLLTVTQ